MADDLEKKMRLLALLNRTVEEHGIGTQRSQNLAGQSASGVVGSREDIVDDFNASDHGDTNDLGFGSDGGAEVRKGSAIDFEDDNGVVIPDM